MENGDLVRGREGERAGDVARSEKKLGNEDWRNLQMKRGERNCGDGEEGVVCLKMTADGSP